ncbi:MAG TPA: TylF/MycF/NovP-related O-methyltransferase [Parvibaculum sp.]
MIAQLRTRIADGYRLRTLSRVAQKVREQRLTYLTPAKLCTLERCLRRIEANNVEGDCAEFGVALGGSAILISALMGPRRAFSGFDVFDTIPPPSARDAPDSHARYAVIASGQSQGIGGDRYYGYENKLYEKVCRHFSRFGIPVDGRRIRLVKGLFEETVSFPPGQALAFAHIDCDWHDPVALCFAKTYERLSRGGVILLDDYNDYGGCRTATKAFLAAHTDMQLVDDAHNAVLVRT